MSSTIITKSLKMGFDSGGCVVVDGCGIGCVVVEGGDSYLKLNINSIEN